MTRAPYTVRLATGLIVTALEESRKLPTQLVTMPMTAVSNAVQAGMRLQQNVAEMVIKGDAVLDDLFNKPEEQPAWARFDEDDEPTDVNIPVGLRAAPEPAAAKPAPKPAAAKPAAPEPEAASAPAAPAKKAPAKKAPAKKAPAKKAAAKTASAKPAGDASDSAAAGRFALYSSVPAGTEAAEPAAKKSSVKKSSGAAPEVAEFLDYDNLTLAQLRAKIRTVDVDDLRVLADYERSSRNRTPFVTMLENRIAAKSDR